MKNKFLKIIIEEVEKWFHGTPDNTEVMKSNSFSKRTNTTTIIHDVDNWEEIGRQMNIARDNGNEDLYFQLLDKREECSSNLEYIKPIYFTNKQSVARTYADPWRAFDYQNANPSIIYAEIDDSGNKLTIDAMGETFRGIDVERFKTALMRDGIDKSIIDNWLGKLQLYVKRNNTITSETMAIIAQNLGYEIIDVKNVIDTYDGKGTKSTVRLVFDPSRIRIG